METETDMQNPKIVADPDAVSGSHRTGTLIGQTASSISNVLGFPPNSVGDQYKVKYEWGFLYEGEACAIWDYKGSADWGQFSCFGPKQAFWELFGASYEA